MKKCQPNFILVFFLFTSTFSYATAFWFWGSGNTERSLTEYGECQWHIPKTDARPVQLSDGRILVPDVLHAAHPSLPLGTYAVIQNVENGNTVTVEITERGPSVLGRVADLSKAAFEQLADLDQKVIECTVTPVEE